MDYREGESRLVRSPQNPQAAPGSEQNPYGREWRASATLVGKMRQYLGTADCTADPEDCLIGEQVHRLLKTLVVTDRTSYLHQDLDQIAKQAGEENWDEPTIMQHIAAAQAAYGLSPEELTQELNRRQLMQLGVEANRQPLVRPSRTNPSHMDVRLPKFSHITFGETTEGSEVQVNMEPVYDAGIDDVAYPLQRINVRFNPDEVETDFEQRFHLDSPLDTELQLHPAIMKHMKDRFAGLVDRYTTDSEEFSYQRDDPSTRKNTDLARDLYHYIEEDYLRENMCPEDYADFQASLGFINSGAVRSVVGLQILADEVLDPDAYIRHPRGWYMEHHPDGVNHMVTLADEELSQLGCQISDGVIENAPEISQRAKVDPDYAARLIGAYETVVQAGNLVTTLLGDEQLGSNERRIKYDLYKSAIRRGLEIARGVINGTSERSDIQQSQVMTG